MKKAVLVLFVLLLFASGACAEVDLSGMSYDELVTLKDQINLTIWNSQEWQEVIVPQGVWEVGVDIPVGHWTIKAADGALCRIEYGSVLDETGKALEFGSGYYSKSIISPLNSTFRANSDATEIDVDAKEGFYFVIDYGSVIFTPYTGKPSLGFK